MDFTKDVTSKLEEIKAQLPAKTDQIKLLKLELIGFERDIRDKKDEIKYNESKELLLIDTKKYTNQAQREAVSFMVCRDKYAKDYKELNNLIDKKSRTDVKIEYEETNLRILFYNYKDLQRLPISEEL